MRSRSGVEHHGRVLATAHQHDAFDRVLIRVTGHDALARRVAFVHLGHVAQFDRARLVEADPHVLQILDAAEDAEAANHEHFRAALDVAARGVAARLFERREHVVQVHAQVDHLAHVRFDVHLAHEATVGHDVRHARHLQQARRNHPILQGAQGHRVTLAALQRVPINLADRRGVRAERRVRFVRQVGVGHALGDLLAGAHRVRRVVEGHGQERTDRTARCCAGASDLASRSARARAAARRVAPPPPWADRRTA